MNKWEYALLALAALIMAISVFLIVDGNILGERTIPASIVLWIIGLSIINLYLIYRLLKAKKSEKEI